MTKQNNSNDDNRYNNTQSFAVVKYKDDSLKKEIKVGSIIQHKIYQQC